MRRFLFYMLSITLISLISAYASVAAGFNSGSTGADGAFNPTTNTELQVPADGIFNFTTVDIPAGVIVTFKKNAANTPVYILAAGDVTIAGIININGADANGIYPGKGGSGGFDGGTGSPTNIIAGKGMGPGGGNNPGVIGQYGYGAGGGGGGFGTNGASGQTPNSLGQGSTGGGTYSNISILPFIGGSGGGGGSGANYSGVYNGGGGGGGGGAILIASSGTITVTGALTANGGKGGTSSGTPAGGGGGGSGGAIKLMADTITGEGAISASGGYKSSSGGTGGNGRIRFEANTVTRIAATNPLNTYRLPGPVFVTNIPALKITSVGGVNVPENPSGTYGIPDITLPVTTTNPVSVAVSGTNIPVGTSVTVTSVPEYGASISASTMLSGTDASSTATAAIALSTQYQCILTAQATFTIQTAMFYEGEKIEKVRVAATMGRGSEVTYITEKGKEIPVEKLMASLMK